MTSSPFLEFAKIEDISVQFEMADTGASYSPKVTYGKIKNILPSLISYNLKFKFFTK